jgi:hypothetical protein
MKTADLYESDFAAWAETNAELLRAGRFSEVDLENVAEEIGDLAKSERRALASRLARLIQHLLKWRFQPEKRGTSWQRTILQQRLSISRLLRDSPSLKPAFAGLAIDVYSEAARLTAFEMRCDVNALPSSSPYTMEQLLDLDYLP